MLRVDSSSQTFHNFCCNTLLISLLLLYPGLELVTVVTESMFICVLYKAMFMYVLYKAMFMYVLYKVMYMYVLYKTMFIYVLYKAMFMLVQFIHCFFLKLDMGAGDSWCRRCCDTYICCIIYFWCC